jgi:NADPH:quinone reductase
MHAIAFDEFGPPEVLYLAELPEPVPGPGKVVVRVSASTVNPTDLMMRSGMQAAMMTDLKPPYIAGMEFSGHIHSVGKGVDLPIGVPVIGLVNPRRPLGGAHAQLVTVPASSIAQIGDGVELIGAATIPMDALTAWIALDLVGLSRGQALLVTGGTGMLGGSVIQLARRRGLVVLTAGRSEEEGLLKELGADIILPRDSDLVESVGKLMPKGVDGLIDGALIGQDVCAAVRTGGAAISLRKSHPIDDERLRVDYVSVLSGMDDAAIIGVLAELIGNGELMPRVAACGPYSFRDAIAAHKQAENGYGRGRLVLTFAE